MPTKADRPYGSFPRGRPDAALEAGPPPTPKRDRFGAVVRRALPWLGVLVIPLLLVALALTPVPQPVRGLAGITLETASGWSLSLDRGEGGLHAVRRDRKGGERTWTVLGASRGEAGILGEGIRQALLRDPTYNPALACANALVD